MLNITNVTFSGQENGEFKSYVSIIFNNKFIIRDIKLVERRDDASIMVCMPSRKGSQGEWLDVAHPLTPRFRAYVERCVLRAWRRREVQPANEEAKV